MRRESARGPDVDRITESQGQSSAAPVLAVGDPSEWNRNGHPLPSESLAFVSFDEVNEETLTVVCPTTIYSPVLANNFDCIELAMLLRNLGYSGAYRAIAKKLPKPEVIEREVRQMCPMLDFKIVETT